MKQTYIKKEVICLWSCGDRIRSKNKIFWCKLEPFPAFQLKLLVCGGDDLCSSEIPVSIVAVKSLRAIQNYIVINAAGWSSQPLHLIDHGTYFQICWIQACKTSKFEEKTALISANIVKMLKLLLTDGLNIT